MLLNFLNLAYSNYVKYLKAILTQVENLMLIVITNRRCFHFTYGPKQTNKQEEYRDTHTEIMLESIQV
jgi:hypothetical protein